VWAVENIAMNFGWHKMGGSMVLLGNCKCLKNDSASLS
jgi:hypothetical protein